MLRPRGIVGEEADEHVEVRGLLGAYPVDAGELGEPGIYVVLLDNKFSALTAKTVEGRLRLLWDEPPPPPAASEGAAGSRNGGGTGSNQLFNIGTDTSPTFMITPSRHTERTDSFSIFQL